MSAFTGYLRPDGAKGIRNLITVIYTVQCSEFVARKIGENFEDDHVLGFEGCHANIIALNVLKAVARHPNVYGLVVCSLGCDDCDVGHFGSPWLRLSGA